MHKIYLLIKNFKFIVSNMCDKIYFPPWKILIAPNFWSFFKRLKKTATTESTCHFPTHYTKFFNIVRSVYSCPSKVAHITTIAIIAISSKSFKVYATYVLDKVHTHLFIQTSSSSSFRVILCVRIFVVGLQVHPPSITYAP